MVNTLGWRTQSRRVKSTDNANYQIPYSSRKPSWVVHSLRPSLGPTVSARASHGQADAGELAGRLGVRDAAWGSTGCRVCPIHPTPTPTREKWLLSWIQGTLFWF